VRDDRPGQSIGAPTDHVTASELAGYVDNDLEPAARVRVEAHLDACTECRHELVEVRRVAQSFRGASRWPSWAWTRLAAGIAVAAGVTLVLLIPGSRSLGPRRAEPVRSSGQRGGTDGRLRIDIVSPTADMPIPASALTFTWHAAAADLYRVTLLTESGEPLWTYETTDSSARIPAATRVRPGNYFWRVDAIGAGITATTGVQRLVIGP
jgi:hypothetical protein